MFSWDSLRKGIRAATVAVAATALAGAGPPKAPSRKISSSLRVYVGTYTSGASRGIYRIELGAATGAVVEGPSLAASSKNPSFLALHPSGHFLYAVNEVAEFQGHASGAVSAFAVDPKSGDLTPLGQQPSEGADPCHLAVDPAGRHVLVANYSSGSVAVLPLSPDGSLRPAVAVSRRTGSGPNKARQQGPHAHQVAFDPSKEFLLSTDLGADRIRVERFDAADGTLRPNEPEGIALEPGSGPRHLAFHPSGRFLYALSELFCTVSAFRWHGDRGALETIQTVSALPAGYSGDNKSAEIAVSPDGRFVYVSNRGDDALSIFAVGDDGRLAPAGRVPTGGRAPRSFAIDPSGRWLLAANQDSGSIVVFRLDPGSGLPRRVGDPVVVPAPTCILFAAGVQAP